MKKTKIPFHEAVVLFMLGDFILKEVKKELTTTKD